MKILIFVLFFLIINSSTLNANTLDEVIDRGYLNCGISENLLGFATVNDKSEWVGFDVDLCRAVSAAIFGDSQKVKFITTTTRSRFPILASGDIDLLARNTTWTFSRDTNLAFEFAGINFYDGQGFMSLKSNNINNINDFQDAKICVESGSAKEFNIDIFFEKNNININKLLVDIDEEALENYLVDRCDIYTNFISELASLRVNLPQSSKHTILPFVISKEPLGPLVRHGDSEWADIVRWSLNTMIIAEELNLTSSNIDDNLDSDNKEILRLLGIIGNYGDMLELDFNWAYNIIKQVGNYASVFNRNLGKDSALGIERGLNALWLNEGLLYSPPFR